MDKGQSLDGRERDWLIIFPSFPSFLPSFFAPLDGRSGVNLENCRRGGRPRGVGGEDKRSYLLARSLLLRCRKLEGGSSAKWTALNNYGEREGVRTFDSVTVTELSYQSPNSLKSWPSLSSCRLRFSSDVGTRLW